MANKYRKLAEQAEKSKPSETPREKGLLEGLRDLPGALAEAAGTVAGDIAEIPGGARAALEQLPNAIPGGQFVVDKARMALGESGQEIAGRRAQLEAEHPIGTALGDVGAMAAGGALLPGAKAATAAGRLAVGGAQAAVMAPAYKLGQVADQAALKGDALHTEAIANAFSFQDSLEAAGLTALMGLPGAAVEAGSAALLGGAKAARNRAVSQAGELVQKGAQKLGMTPEDAGALVLDEGLLEHQGAAKRQMQDAGKRMGNAVKSAQLDAQDLETMAQEIVALGEAQENNALLAPARKQLAAQAKALANVQSGEELEAIIQTLKSESRSAYQSKKNQKGELFGDAAEILRGRLSDHLDIIDPRAGAEYRSAVQDYNTYAKLAPEVAAGAKKQVKLGAVARDIGKAGAATAAGSLLGGPVGGAVALGAELAMPGATSSVRGKSTAVLLNKLSKMAPGQQHIDRATEVTEMLLGAPAMAANQSVRDNGAEKDVPKRYADVAKALRSSMADPTGTASKLRAQLDFLPPHVADAVTANQMNKLQCLALALPPETGPATAFGITTDVPDRAKREFLRRAQDAFDPYGAVLSGSPMRVKESEKYNPETINDLRKRVIERIAENPKLPYSTK
ncbi:MAG TPA: hypothetical protein VFH51_11535, partial [Myxococcota bacterium]|nr:hypothetical protein [Myxococcota bacterium]